ncbi:MAG TPA: PspC domain-containing protein [Desulfosporosinus sp.]|nr:PspC domain-containing protein [Desulfosporosinus sp.]
MTEKLYRSKREKMIGGVCGGLADYFSIDVTLVRLIALVALFGGVGFFIYLAGWAIIPEDPNGEAGQAINYKYEVGEAVKGMVSDVKEATQGLGRNENQGNNENRSKMAGGILVILGVFFLLQRVLPYWFDMSKMWPVLLIVIGLAIILRGGRK